MSISRLKDVALERMRRLILVDVQEPDRLGPLKVLSSHSYVEVHIFGHHGAHKGDTEQTLSPWLLKRPTSSGGAVARRSTWCGSRENSAEAGMPSRQRPA